MGDSCEDGNPDTINDTIQEDCECVGTTSTVDELESVSMLIYPNPANDYINISSNFLNGTIRIMALNGQIVKEIVTSNLISGQRVNLVLDNGIYLVEVSSNGNSTMRKLVISN